jgi:peptide chain release factor 1
MNSAKIVHLPTGLVRTAQTRSRENSLALAMQSIHADLDRLAEGAARSAENSVRQRQVGTGERSDRRRTWAFQRDCVEDFRSGKRMRCGDALKGFLDRLW